MRKIKIEFIVEVSDELATLLEHEKITPTEVQLSLLKEAFEPLAKSALPPKELPQKTGNAYADSLITELKSRGFNLNNLALLSHERVKRLIFGKPTWFRYNEEGNKQREAEKEERDHIVSEVGQTLGVVFKKSIDDAAMSKVIGSRKVRPLEAGLDVYSLVDLETVRLSEFKRVKNIGKKSIEELASLAEDGKLKLAE